MMDFWAILLAIALSALAVAGHAYYITRYRPAHHRPAHQQSAVPASCCPCHSNHADDYTHVSEEDRRLMILTIEQLKAQGCDVVTASRLLHEELIRFAIRFKGAPAEERQKAMERVVRLWVMPPMKVQ